MSIESDFYRLESEGDTDLVTMVGFNQFVLKAGETKMVPWQVVDGLFGDPRITNGEYDKRRDDVYDYLLGVYGAKDLGGEIPHRIPQVKVYDSSGNRFLTLLDDPSGEETLTVQASTEHSDVEMMRRQIEAMQKQMEAIASGGGDTDQDPTEPPVDDITKVKVK